MAPLCGEFESTRPSPVPQLGRPVFTRETWCTLCIHRGERSAPHIASCFAARTWHRATEVAPCCTVQPKHQAPPMCDCSAMTSHRQHLHRVLLLNYAIAHWMLHDGFQFEHGLVYLFKRGITRSSPPANVVVLAPSSFAGTDRTSARHVGATVPCLPPIEETAPRWRE